VIAKNVNLKIDVFTCFEPPEYEKVVFEIPSPQKQNKKNGSFLKNGCNSSDQMSVIYRDHLPK
jgi:hypothetical protein